MFPLPAPPRDPFVHLVLGVVCLASIWTDLRDQEIWDVVTVPAALLGLGLAWGLHGPGGLKASAFGLGLSIFVFGMGWILGLVESGDVFLMAAAGALLRYPAAATAMVLSTIFGLPVAAAWLTWKGKWRNALGNFGRLFRRHWQGRVDEEVELTPFPFGVAIGLACLYTAAAAYWPALLPG